MAQTISGTHLLDPEVIAEPYGFYEELRADAPVWEVPGTGIFTVATFHLLAEAAGRVEDFSSNLNCLLYRDAQGMPCRLSFGDAGVQALATADPQCTLCTEAQCFLNLSLSGWLLWNPTLSRSPKIV
jgi:hypothetical protein